MRSAHRSLQTTAKFFWCTASCAPSILGDQDTLVVGSSGPEPLADASDALATDRYVRGIYLIADEAPAGL